MKCSFRFLSALAVASALPLFCHAAPATSRLPSEDVSSPVVRLRQHLTPDANLLFNGLGLSPAGTPVSIGDLPLKMVVAPDRKTVIAVCAGFKEVGVHVVGLAAPHKSQFIPLMETFNGLAFSPNGKKFYVAGGSKGLLYVFKYSHGKAKLERTVRPNQDAKNVFLAGITVNSDGTLFVCNEANDEIWVLSPRDFSIERTIGTGQFPYTCLLGADGRNLYVSNWGSRSVTVIDTKTSKRVRDLAVGVRPNDMALARDGRLFVACAGDNTVHVISTGTLEKAVLAPSPKRRVSESSREILSTSLYPDSPEGSTPCAVAVSPDG
ncbi:MAG TPA: SMP-30/gluconolactonase/LRE family protein, partial [Verrucomicrobiae bacterium]|nr:SMP-30/gluconolactonase/LRE family protein [Verrucomicrobiae bacterium]